MLDAIITFLRIGIRFSIGVGDTDISFTLPIYILVAIVVIIAIYKPTFRFKKRRR